MYSSSSFASSFFETQQGRKSSERSQSFWLPSRPTDITLPMKKRLNSILETSPPELHPELGRLTRVSSSNWRDSKGPLFLSSVRTRFFSSVFLVSHFSTRWLQADPQGLTKY